MRVKLYLDLAILDIFFLFFRTEFSQEFSDIFCLPIVYKTLAKLTYC